MLTCSKTYFDIPFAHRQHLHDGHCAKIHGHNWDFSFTFGCHELSPEGFVVDFGKLDFIREWIYREFDHACVFNGEDPCREALISGVPSAWKVKVVDNCSSEGLAQYLFTQVDLLVRQTTKGRVFLTAVEVREDRRNSARCTSENPAPGIG